MNKSALYQVKQCDRLSKKITRMILQPQRENNIQHQAGQYIFIALPEKEPVPFSIANAPADDHHIELHIQNTAENQDILTKIQKTGKLNLQGPLGNSVYQASYLPTIYVAGGTGFAPIKAIIEETLAQQKNWPMHLYWGVRDWDDLYLSQLVQQWEKNSPHFQYTPVISENMPENWQGKTGLVAETVAQDYPDLSQYRIYAAGPFDMLKHAIPLFDSLSIKRENLHSDIFDFMSL